MQKSKFRIVKKSSIFIHKDIANAVFFLFQRVEQREKNDDREGIAFDYWSCLLLIAYWQEALFNFHAHHRGKKGEINFWKYTKKITRETEFNLGDTTQNFKLFKDLREFRNHLAHGKPSINSDSEEFISTKEEALQRAQAIVFNDWESKTNFAFTKSVYRATEELEAAIYKSLNLKITDVYSGYERHLQLLGPAVHTGD